MSIRGIRRALSIPRFTQRHLDRDVTEEMAFHIARRAEHLVARGMPRAQAEAEAARRFGDMRSLKREVIEIDRSELRRERFMDLLDHTRADLRFAVRSFRRAPGFTIVALVTLVVGIAALTSIFSYYNAVYNGRLPYKDADRIVALSEEQPRGFTGFSSVAPEVLPFLRAAHSFERISAYDESGTIVLFGTEPKSIRTLAIDTAFIPLVQLRPAAGRLINAEEIVAGAPVAMISDILWRAQYGGDSAAIGRHITLAQRDYTIVGVMSPEFRFPWQTDAITPLRDTAGARDPHLSVLGKLRMGVTREAARNELATIAPRLRSIDSKVYAATRLVARDEMLDRKTRQFLPLPGVFLGAGLFLLLIACANVTNLFYARAAERAGEMAVRASLGAGRARLVRQMLTESLLLSAAAAALGTALSGLVVRLWLHFIPTTGFPSWFHVSVDMRVLLFAIGVTALVTIAVGLSPAREGTRFDLVRTLKRAGDGGMSASSAIRGSKRGLVLQLALSITLFIGGALLARSFQHMTELDPGFPAAKIATVLPFFDRGRFTRDDGAMRFLEQVADEARSSSAVKAVAIRGGVGSFRDAKGDVVVPPKREFRRYVPRLVPDGDTTRAAKTYDPAYRQYVVSDDYFKILMLPVMAGRTFNESDVGGGALTAVLSAEAAKQLWGTRSAIGRSVQMDGIDGEFTVIGVVGNVRDLVGGGRGMSAEPGVTIYLSDRQLVAWNPEIVATSTGDVMAARSAVVAIVRRLDPLTIIYGATTMASQMDESLMVTKIFGGVIGALAASALLLSIVGIYGVVAFSVAQRTREIGIRIALGGTSANVLRMITLEALAFVAVGLAIGLALSIAVSRLLKVLLFGVSAVDPLTYVLVSVGFGAVAVLACYLPARRATRVDPLVALRTE